MKLRESCLEYFHSSDLYDVLMVSKTASPAELKKAYKKVSLKVHPDRVADDEKELATKKFQVLAKVYYILSDAEKRAVYDETGEVNDESDIPEDKDWDAYFRLLFPRVTAKAIEDFMKKYRGSNEELEDLKKCYITCEGDMDKMSECLIGYDISTEKRYCSILQDMIDNEELPEFTKFTEETPAKKKARKRRFEKEARKAEKAAKVQKLSEPGSRGLGDLEAAIARRAKSREESFGSLIKNLEMKYGKKK